MQLIDTHAHIYLPEFDSDREVLINNAISAGVSKILMPAIDTHTHTQMLLAEEQYESCTAMMGLHPCSVNDTVEEELRVVEEWLSKRAFVAVGEIGLDFYWDRTFTEQQYTAFHRQIELAVQYNIPIVIHSRNATDECIDVVRQHPGVHGVFHCFSGDLQQAEQVIDLGLYLGIGGVVTFKNSGLDKVVEKTGLERVILETDAPYLAPVPFRGKRNQSAYLAYVVEKLATLTNQNIEDVAKITTDNAIKLFNL